MTKQYMSMENLRFLLYEVHKIQDLLNYKRYEHVGGIEEINLMINAAKDIADKEMFPFFKEMDEKPVVFKDGKIHSHPQLKNIFKAIADAGWFSATSELEQGGMQLPFTLYSAGHLIFEAANSSAQGYIGLSTGALELIEAFGDKSLNETYVPNMIAGKWQGTMALTEPQAGSSLSDITAAANPTESGYYEIVGQKIFISGGEHEACDNFIHLTLARIKGAPAGTKGISLFVIPKFIPENGNLTYNNVVCAGDFQKMGQRGYATTHLVFGESGITKGFLVGEANKGLFYMFQMMNSARIAVGQTAAAVASAAYYASLHYANERPQGRPIASKDLAQEQILIINHADVRRMLFQQKAIVEGSLSLIYECLKYFDLEKATEGDEKEKMYLLLEILTPIVKTYPSDAGITSVSNALQVLGGYGFTMDFDLQQYYRDIRIMSIYEGTSGIQSLDLLGRKIPMQNGKAFQLLVDEIMQTIIASKDFDELHPYSDKLALAMETYKTTLSHLQEFAKQGEIERYLADATLFMELSGIITIAWQWLKQATISQKALKTGETTNQSIAFYESKIATMKFFFKYELPKYISISNSLMNPEIVTIKTDKEMLI
ncbi:acyl-CoA dehydrogenase [Flavobacterium sp.]|uniref:acyl-CoA dehydrogenase n=1 Tax=Flavobacterium sp. TaxID=239 RepID=UPI0037521208